MLVPYWTRELNREFKQDWQGKDADGLPDAVTEAAEFAKDVMMEVAPEAIDELPRAMREAVRTLRVKPK